MVYGDRQVKPEVKKLQMNVERGLLEGGPGGENGDEDEDEDEEYDS